MSRCGSRPDLLRARRPCQDTRRRSLTLAADLLATVAATLAVARFDLRDTAGDVPLRVQQCRAHFGRPGSNHRVPTANCCRLRHATERSDQVPRVNDRIARSLDSSSGLGQALVRLF